MLVPSRNVIPSWTPRCWARSSRRSQTPRRAQRMKVWAARDHGPRSAGMARHLAPFSCRQTIADSVRRRSFGCVLPLGRHASTNGSKLIQCASDSIALSSFQEGQNARHHNRFKREQALAQDSCLAADSDSTQVNDSHAPHLCALAAQWQRGRIPVAGRLPHLTWNIDIGLRTTGSLPESATLFLTRTLPNEGRVRAGLC